MFDKNFFPTPSEVIQKMIAPHLTEHRKSFSRDLKVLDPSAGKGDILDYISENTRYPKGNLYAIELQPELQSILASKDYKLIGSDFLLTTVQHNFDLIVMNPPFDRGASHLLKAWEILTKGDIVCLLNAATYDNPHTKERELLKQIIDENGSVEHLGQCFKNAERKTDVEVIMVRLSKSENYYYEIEGDFSFENIDFDDIKNNNSTEVEVLDKLLSMERRYNASVEAFKELARAKRKFENLSGPLRQEYSDFNVSEFLYDHNGFINNFNKSCWNRILNDTKFVNLMTNKVRQSFQEKFSSHQQNLAFTKENMMLLYQSLFYGTENILNDCLLEVFDFFTKYHEENRTAIEGWKTNDAYKVNKKIILGWCVRYGDYMSKYDLDKCGDTFSINWGKCEQLKDVERALGYLTGDRVENIVTIKQALEDHFSQLGKVYTGQKFSNTCESHFFTIKFFKKGTIHLEFKSDQVWQLFNQKACELRGFPLPAQTAKSKRQAEKEAAKKNRKETSPKAKKQASQAVAMIGQANTLESEDNYPSVKIENQEYIQLSKCKNKILVVLPGTEIWKDQFGFYRPSAQDKENFLGQWIELPKTEQQVQQNSLF